MTDSEFPFLNNRSKDASILVKINIDLNKDVIV